MNWYKLAKDPIKENPHYTNIGHGDPGSGNVGNELDAIWISDLNGNNFHRSDTASYEHHGLALDVGLNIQTGVIKGRYDSVKNIVSISINPYVVTMKEFPNRLIERLYKEFGNNITILDYSHGIPKRVI